MATFLFNEIVFGPVKSRRLGVSLGVNLLPYNTKVCSFNCIYCECGWTLNKQSEKTKLPTRAEVREKLEKTLGQMASMPDVITFAGNGEPTLHPEFAGIIDDTIEVRNMLAPKTRIAVLSNATMLHKEPVFNALLKVDDNIQKLDSACYETIQIINSPNTGFDLQKVVNQLAAFNGKVTIQTILLRGSYNGRDFDNTTETEIAALLKLLAIIKPAHVMLYTIARNAPVDSLIKISSEETKAIAIKFQQAGFSVQVS